jgi:2-iminoacetate synthase ThiH
MEREVKEKRQAQTVTDLFKSIVHEETNQKNELEETLGIKHEDKKDVKKAAAPAAAPAAKPALAHLQTSNNKQQVQQQTANLMKGLNKIHITKPGQSLVQASITKKAQQHQEEDDDEEFDPMPKGNLEKYDVGVTEDDYLVQQ